eukprot:Tbor_TRINITY_DN3266_c0_g1::TRINITY_DN3266_c0_g1_i1::g.23732::m.23732
MPGSSQSESTDKQSPHSKKKRLNGSNIEYRYPSGSVYVGGFKDGKLDSYGKYKYFPSKDEYEGEWLLDLKHGHGVYTYFQGDKYIGEWRSGKKYGKGVYMFTSGDEYIGSWKDDRIHGFGSFRIARNGNHYEGNWQESYRHGYGVLTSGNGDCYQGEWKAGKENGLGLLHYANGNIYVGDWKTGQMDGKGILLENGIKHIVEHIAGYMISKVQIDPTQEIEPDWMNADNLYREYQRNEKKEIVPDKNRDSEMLTKVTMDVEMWKLRYENLVKIKTADLTLESDDIEALKRRIESLVVAHENEKRRADDAVSKEKILQSEIYELQIAATQNSVFNKAKEDTVPSEDVEELRAMVANLQRELDHRGAKNGIADENPIDLKVKLELAEGELKNLRQARDEMYRLRDQNMDNIKIIEKVELRNQELMKEMNVYRARASNLQSQIHSDNSKECKELREDLESVTNELEAAKKAKLESDAALSNHLKRADINGTGNARIRELENEIARLKNREDELVLNTNPDLKKDQVESLRRQNAELKRQIEELQSDMKMADGKKDKRLTSVSHDKNCEDGASPEVIALQSDLKKEKKRNKKAISERDAIALELYNEQIVSTRLSRTLENFRGRVSVFVCLDNHDQSGETFIKVNPDNPAELVIGNTKKNAKSSDILKFDGCAEGSAAPKEIFDEVKSSLMLAADGFHTSLVTFGPMGSGKSYFVEKVSPMVVKALFEIIKENSTSSTATFNTTVKISGIEVSYKGIFDAVSGNEIKKITRNMHTLESTAVGETYIDVKSAKDAISNINKLLTSKRKITSGRSHFYIHIKLEMRHRVLNLVKTGKFTLLDLCGQGSLVDQESDIESGKYINTTTAYVNTIIEDLVNSSENSTVASSTPFDTDTFTMLLADVFGGNCIANVVACANATNSTTLPESVAALRLSSKACRIVNRPILQNIESPDIMRLRKLVTDAFSQDEANTSTEEVSNNRL